MLSTPRCLAFGLVVALLPVSVLGQEAGSIPSGELQIIGNEGKGVLIYLRQEGRGIGLLKKLQAYNLQDQGMDTVDANIHLGHLADEREYTFAALMLQDLKVKSIKLITNNPRKIDELKKLGINVEDRIPIEPAYHNDNRGYLKTKAEKMSHMLTFPEDD